MHRRKSKVELFEQIRREYEHGVGTIKGVAQKFGVHRRMVREAIESAVPKATEESGTREAEDGGVNSVDREDPGDGPEGTPETAAHGAPHLVPSRGGAVRGGCGGVHRAGIRAEEEDRVGAGARRGVRSANVSLGPGRTSGLVRSLRGGRRRAGQSLRILFAEHGQRPGVSPGVSARQPTGVSGSA